VKRGEIWTQAGGPGYAGKPRPALVLQSDLIQSTESVIICLFTSHESGSIRWRLPFARTAANGLLEDSDLMADKIMAVARNKLGRCVGAVSPADMLRVQEAVFVVLGFEE
jgi:mRNA interferase MazF